MVTFALKKKTSEQDVISTITIIGQQVDMAGETLKEIEATKKKIKDLTQRLKTLNAEHAKLQVLVDELAIGDDDATVVAGAKYQVEIGPRGISRSIQDLEKAREFLGDELFMQLATITLKNLDDYLTPPQKEIVIKTDRTNRSIKFIKR